MRKSKFQLVLLLIANLPLFCLAFVDPLTVGISIGIGVGWIKYDFLKENTYCQFKECCIARYLKKDVTGLKRQLENKLFGQHIVQEVMVNAIGAHLKNIESSRKPLVMSFHGTSGTGKNYVSDIVASSLYEKGFESKYVHKYSSDYHLAAHVQQYQRELVVKIKQAVQDCPFSLFIFDEIEKMPEGVFDSIVSLLDHHSSMKGYDFSKAIFIFLSNSAGVEIARKLKSITDVGRWRDETKLQDFESIAEMGAYNVFGGLYRSGIIESHVIDHFVPFLPLEPRHVEQCIKTEFNLFCHSAATDEKIKEILKMAMTFDETGIYSNNGCKRISKKVEAYCYKM